MITFLLTDIVGSTARWDQDPEAMAAVVRRHDEIVATVVGQHRGRLVKSRGEGDSSFSTFTGPRDAAAAALGIHRCLRDEPWPGAPVAVRIGIHLGETEERDDDFYGPTVNRAARIRAMA